MKKLFTLLAFAPGLLIGQNLVSSNAENRTVLVEEFTGVNCGYCPEGHVIAQSLLDQHGRNAVAVNIHAGGYAVPSAGQIDFRTPEGTAIDAFFGPAGYPSGVVQRLPFNGALTLNRGSWVAAAEAALNLSSPVNIGLESSYNSGSSVLEVNVAIEYTAAGTGGNDYISVYLLESGIVGYQADYTNGSQANYVHNHALRAALTPNVWGDEVLISTAGHSETRTYSYTVPSNFNIANCEVVAFIGEYQGEVYQAREVIADGGTTLITGELNLTASTPYAAGSVGSVSSFGTQFTNTLPQQEDFVVNLTSGNAPADWTSAFTINGTNYTAQTTVPAMSGVASGIDVEITPGATVGVADYVLTISSASNPLAPVHTQEFHVISGVTDLVLDNPGIAVDHGPIYDAGLTLANQPGRARTAIGTAVEFASAGALSDVVNLYYNVSWTFPAFSDATVAQLESLMDNGVNLFIAGQDIGWDVMSGNANANGTPAGQSFYTNYLMADFIADGSTANTQINFETSDAVFGAVAATTINSVFGTNSYPEEILPLAGASALFRYNTPTKVGGIRGVVGNSKVVYLGIGVEQFQNSVIAEQVVQLSHDWFYGVVGTEEFDAAIGNLLGQAYPVPANTMLTVPFEQMKEPGTLLITDISGKEIAAIPVASNSTSASLNVSDYSVGVYSYRITTKSGLQSETKLFEVTH